MTTNKIIGIILIILGVVSFAWQGINYKTRETVVDIGPIHATAEKTHTIPIHPIIGGLCLAGGILLIVVSPKRS